MSYQACKHGRRVRPTTASSEGPTVSGQLPLRRDGYLPARCGPRGLASTVTVTLTVSATKAAWLVTLPYLTIVKLDGTQGDF
jgi:hypothetical protein